MELNWLYSLLEANGLTIDNVVSTEWYNFLRELLHHLELMLEEYFWGEHTEMPTYPPQPMCFPEDEEKIIIPGLHRMGTNYTLDYVIYREYVPSEFPPMVVEQPVGYGEEYGFLLTMIQLIRALMTIIFPRLPSALRRAPIGRKESFVIGWGRCGRLIFKDSWSFGWSIVNAIVSLAWQWITYVLSLLTPYLLFTLLTLLIIFLVCNFHVFQRIALYEDYLEYRISHLPIDVLNLMRYIIGKIGMALSLVVCCVWRVLCIPQRVCTWVRYVLLPIAIRIACGCIEDSVRDVVDYVFAVILFVNEY